MQAHNYCHRWRCSSITWCCTLITLDILLLSVENYLRVCKFLHYANDIAKASETGGQTTSASQPFSLPTYVMILLRQDNSLYFYVNNSQLLEQRRLFWQGLLCHTNHPPSKDFSRCVTTRGQCGITISDDGVTWTSTAWDFWASEISFRLWYLILQVWWLS